MLRHLISGAATPSSWLGSGITWRMKGVHSHTDDAYYYIIEYLPGLNLAELIARDGCMPVARVLYILWQICASLEEAHGKGLIHRDIKPANIMLCERGGQYDVVKVLDFGLVKSMSARAGSQITRTGDLISGTPLYMAPEYIRHPSGLDPRSDLYSVGTVAFFLLTGADLYTGDTLLDILDHVLHEKPRRPSAVVGQQVPLKLDELVFALVAKDPDDRPASAPVVIELLDALRLELPWPQADAKQAWQSSQTAVADRPLQEEASRV